ncbi:hypothetical protein [Romboutsia sp. Marseille-P6047]|uniref:hypothetical protein n=1 Tax=Romboutsia sp. Marseille-P6047 TaxID=2161817 RepID=UPI0013DD98EE|nr:hypothetical protein [Romboutsia sp. Marseille-P6047]
MKTCTQCNNKFTFIDRLKFLFNGHLKCTHCNADYRSEANIYREYTFYYTYVEYIYI